MKINKALLIVLFSSILIGLNAFGSVVRLGEQQEIEPVIVPIDITGEDDTEIIKSLQQGVVYVSAKQTCTARMGCTCKHRSRDLDTMKIHHPEEDPYDGQDSWKPHLDIKCTKCNPKWFCPAWNKFRS